MNVPGFRYLEHVADCCVEVKAENSADLFYQSMLALYNVMEPNSSSEFVIRDMELEAANTEDLLIAFLNEILFSVDSYYEVYDEIDFLDLNDKRIKAQLQGKKISQISNQIKAATYHEFSIKIENGVMNATFILDL